MSIVIYAFLGPDTENLEARVLQAFSALGFTAHYHPQLELLKSDAGGCMYMSFLQTPPHLQRVSKGTPLLLAFDYSVSQPKGHLTRSAGWPPRNVSRHSYEIQTRTSASRSHASYFAQALTAAILAKETKGYFYVDGDDVALPGDQGLERIAAELGRAGGYEFDADAHPFLAWPSLESPSTFVWPEPLISRHLLEIRQLAQRPKKRIQFTVTGVAGAALVLGVFILTIVYS